MGRWMSRQSCFRRANRLTGSVKMSRVLIRCHTASYRSPYNNMHYVLTAGGNAFYERRDPALVTQPVPLPPVEDITGKRQRLMLRSESGLCHGFTKCRSLRIPRIGSRHGCPRSRPPRYCISRRREAVENPEQNMPGSPVGARSSAAVRCHSIQSVGLAAKNHQSPF